MKEKQSIESILNSVLDKIIVTGKEQIDLDKAVGRFVAERITAREDVPSFHSSRFDGYAVKIEDVQNATEENPVFLKVVVEIPAGHSPKEKIGQERAARIFTGAPIPAGVNAIIKNEAVEEVNGGIKVQYSCVDGQGIANKGFNLAKGNRLAEVGDEVTPGLIGCLATQGIENLTVFKKIKVGVFSIGSELVELGGQVEEPYIRSSNYYMLMAACRASGVEVVPLGLLADKREEITEKINYGLESCDMLISSGGAMNGKYDLVALALEKSKAQLFQRGVGVYPGHACAYGNRGNKLYFGLSGSPGSAMTNFNLIVLPAIRKAQGRTLIKNRTVLAILGASIQRKNERDCVVRGQVEVRAGTIYFIPIIKARRASMQSLIDSEALLVLQNNCYVLEQGKQVFIQIITERDLI